MQEKYTLNTALAAVVGLGCLAAVLYRVFLSAAVLPAVGLPAAAACSLLALAAEAYLSKGVPRRNWGLTLLLGALTFGLLPWAAGLTAGTEAVRFAVDRRRGLRRSNLPVYLPAGAPRLRPIRTAGPPGHRRHSVSGLPVLCRDAPGNPRAASHVGRRRGCFPLPFRPDGGIMKASKNKRGERHAPHHRDHRPLRPRTGRIRPPDRGPAPQPPRAGEGPVHRGEPQSHRPRPGRRI